MSSHTYNLRSTKNHIISKQPPPLDLDIINNLKNNEVNVFEKHFAPLPGEEGNMFAPPSKNNNYETRCLTHDPPLA